MSRLLDAIARLFRPAARKAERQPSRLAPTRVGRVAGIEPGRAGVDATVQVDPRRLKGLRTSYNPKTDGEPDPGEIVWTWVPYEENDGRGKDRPVLVVAVERSGSLIAVALTSQAHPGRPEYLAIGAGDWDGRGRPSFVRLARVFRVHRSGMRREAAALDARRFATVRTALRGLYGWS